MTRTDQLWHKFAGPARTAIRPNFRFDPTFHAGASSSIAKTAVEPGAHLAAKEGAAAGHGSLYSQLHQQAPHIDKGLIRIVTHPELKVLIEAGDPDALHLAFELIQLGTPVDTEIADFSMQAYLEWHPDIVAAGMNPLMHYLCHAMIEGHHRSLTDLREDLHEGARPFHPEYETVLICLPDLAHSEAFLVIREMLRQTDGARNIIVAALEGGGMLDQILPHCCAVQITRKPLLELPYARHTAFRQVDRAILYRAKSAWFIHHCVAQDIPFAAYIDDHVEETPAWQSSCLTAFADLLAFSSDHIRDNWRGCFSDIGFATETDSTVIPPYPLTWGAVTETRRIEARQTISRVLGRDIGKARLICGTGPIGMRCGTEIFSQAAQIAAGLSSNTVFIWIGDGLNHQEAGYGTYLDYQLRQLSGDSSVDNLFLLPDGPLYSDLLEAADAMFLSARLGPIPHAAFDALRHGCHVVCFEGATGLADPRYRGSGRIRCTPYGNPFTAAQALLALPQKTGQAPAPIVPAPASSLARIDLALRDRLSRQRNFVLGESAFDIPLLFTKAEADHPLRRREREKMFSYNRRLLWRDVKDARDALAASGSWLHERIRIEDYADVGPDGRMPDYAIHIHAFYTDHLADDLRSHAAAFERASRIVVTTDTQGKAEVIRAIGEAQGLRIETQLVPNQGRDILPFLRLFGAGGLGGEGLWCHLHQKRSVQTTSHGDVWKRFLHRILLGGETCISNALVHIAHPGTGLVAPFEPHHLGWGESRRLLPSVAGAFPGSLPDAPLLFPVGNMFWTRGDVAREMLDLLGDAYPWPNEPIATDGTVFHLIERLWPAVAARMGLNSVFLHKQGEERV